MSPENHLAYAGNHLAYMNWSGGKDSALCLYRVLKDKRYKAGTYKVGTLLTNINKAYERVSMHGVRRRLQEMQAEAIGLPLQFMELPAEPGMSVYGQAVAEKTKALLSEGYTHALFGDIFLEDLRRYREEQIHSLGVQCVFPLWGESSAELMKEFLGLGFKAVIVCVDGRRLDRSWCGREIDEAFLRDLPEGVDPCGENGEYHSFVYDGPLFREPVSYSVGEVVHRQLKVLEAPADFYFCDLLPG